jgi:hypothetical protein
MIFRRGWHFGGRTVRAYSVSHPHVSRKALDHSFSGIAPYPELIRQRGFVRCGSIASFRPCVDHFRCTPISRRFLSPSACLKCATCGLLRRTRAYSITSSASICIETGTSIPSALAVFKLMTSSNFVGCSTGRSAGFLPIRIWPVRAPPCRYSHSELAP